MRGPCAKRRVVCIIYPRGQAPIRGENDCANPQLTCPRLPGEGYEKCKTVCQQAGHAETEAVRKAIEWGAALDGAKAEIGGHYWICEPCGRALLNAGITDVRIIADAFSTVTTKQQSGAVVPAHPEAE